MRPFQDVLVIRNEARRCQEKYKAAIDAMYADLNKNKAPAKL